MTVKELFEVLRKDFQQIINTKGLTEEKINVSTKSLTPKKPLASLKERTFLS